MVDFFAKFKDKIIAFFSKDSKKSSEKRLKEINGSKNLIIFIAGSLGIATFLVVISLVLYTADGTIQLDLSRPVLQEAREAQKKAKEEDEKQKKNEKMDGICVEYARVYGLLSSGKGRLYSGRSGDF